MAIVAMQKVAILAHRSHKEQILEVLQEMGVLEIHEAKELPSVDHTEVQYKEAELEFAIETLKNFASKETQKAMTLPVNSEEVLQAVKKTDVRSIIDRLHLLEESDTATERVMNELQTKIDVLSPWSNLPYRLDDPTSTETTERILGTIPEAKVPELEMLANTGNLMECERVGMRNGIAYYSVVLWKKNMRSFEENATTLGWTTVSLPTLPGLPSVLHEEAIMEHKKMLQRKKENRDERIKLSLDLPNLRKVRLYFTWLNDKQVAREAMLETFATVTLLGWIPRNSIQSIEEKLHSVTPAVTVLKVKVEENEEPPILLKNSKLITPFESVTTLYGYPLPTEMDPTGPLSPFFALYFALCLTDGGYGLVLTTVFGAYLLLTRKSVNEAKLPWLLFISGIASILVGIPFGGWFGLTVDQVPSFLTTTDPDGTQRFIGQVWNLSTQEGIGFLQNLAIVLGVTHIFFGVFLAGWFKFIHGNRAEAFWQHFSLHILLGAALFQFFAPEEMKPVATYILYGAIALAIWGKGHGSTWYMRPLFGVLGLVNFGIGLLSNGLSYLRILALGLVTGAIALAVNQVAIEMGNLFPLWLGIPVTVLIAVGGHLVSIALNTLGSYIHSGRLQFIEFFGQFFEGGGRPYSPFRRTL